LPEAAFKNADALRRHQALGLDGRRIEGFVQPAWIFNRPTTIKALHRTPDTNSADFMEDDDDRTEYTLDELAVIAENLAENYAAFHDFVSETHLIEGGEDGAG
jgi:hypothetical protein